jgi:uncharacterized protein YqgQ
MNFSLKTLKACILVILILMGCLLTISFSMDSTMDQGLSEQSKMLYGFIARTSKKLGKKYGMSPCGLGGGAREDGIRLMCLRFERYGDPLTEEAARRLIINCVGDFLQFTNNDGQLRPFLKDYPFTAKNLSLAIFNYDQNQVLHYFPYIAIVTNSEGKIGFLTKIASAEYGYHTEKYETYDEAVAIVKKEHETNDSKASQ